MELQKLGKYFILIFAISFLVVNWNEVSWVFNYKALSAILSDFFQSENAAIATHPFKTSQIEASQSKSMVFEYSDKEDSLEIPKIEVLVPLSFVDSLNEKELYPALDKGVIHFPGSALPGEPGQTVILGHSAIHNWPKTKYAWVFTYLNELTEGDEIFVFFNHRKYPYSVTKKFFLDKGEDLSEEPLTNSENVLILLSCWPPGKDRQRIALEAALLIQ